MSNSLIPANIMKMLGNQYKTDNREMIISYLVSEEGSVVLTDKQKELMHRWDVADDLMRSRRYTGNEVAKVLSKKFEYSVSVAFRDMEDARFVYGSTRKSNKQYLLALHVDRIEAAIVLAEQQGRKEILPKLYEVYTKALDKLPEDSKENNAPAAIIFNISTNQSLNLLPQDMTAADAARTAENKLTAKGLRLDIDDITPEL